MKKTLFYLASIFILGSAQNAVAQFDNGNYVFEDSEIKLELAITDNGWEIENAKVTYKATNKVVSGSGDYIHSNGVEWYQIETDECNYEFDYSENELLVTRYDCNDGQSDKKFTLKRK